MKQRRLVADLHLHSRFSMGTSPSLDLRALATGARTKGINLLAAPDYTHPDWLAEMRRDLREVAPGTYEAHGARFVLVTEVSCVFQQGGRGRRIHLLIAAPSIEAAERFGAALAHYQDLRADGRPALPLSARGVAEIAWGIDDSFEVIPAHIWTPWFGLLGSRSGFDSIEECFGDLANRIRAIETGLSSDPAMNWGVPAIGDRKIVSFSDAHSPPTMGRELTVFDTDATYAGLIDAIRNDRVVETIEFHPEHGKYHMDGHRKCGVRFTPAESKQAGGRCPVCGRKLTLGVLNRVEQLTGEVLSPIIDDSGLKRSPAGRPPFRSLVPLRELASAALGVGPASKRVRTACAKLVEGFGSELRVLIDVPLSNIELIAGARVAEAVGAIRRNELQCEPGFDGQYGVVIPSLRKQ